ncbi:MAG: phosphatase PAP2 family protein, partial [Muribaculaceae bacterium]|nr:phosphatase PAP2 family protein [Muribaculaceae bacterium]
MRIIASLILLVSIFAVRAAAPDSLYRSYPEHRATDIAIRAVGAMAVNATATEVLKLSIHEMRPDRSSNNSFPSRHTSWAFEASSVLANEFFKISPWIPAAAQGAASAVALQRIITERHYASDAVAGAVTGIASTQAAYYLAGLITGRPLAIPASDAEFRPSLSLFTEAVYNLGHSSQAHICTGMSAGLKLVLPLRDKYGISLSALTAATPMRTDGTPEAHPLKALGLTLGGTAHFSLPCRSMALEPAIEAGTMRNLNDDIFASCPKFSFIMRAGCGLLWQLTPSFGVRGTAAYSLTTLDSPVSAICIS